MEMDDNKRRRNMILYVLIAFVVYLVLSTVLFPNIGHTQQITKTDYSTFVKALDKKSVDKVEYNTDDYSIYYTKKGDDENIAYKTTGVPNDAGFTDRVLESGASLESVVPDKNSGLMTYYLLTLILPIAIFFLIGWWLNRRMKKAMGDDGPSMNTIHGAFSLACLNRSRTLAAPRPTNISTNTEPEILKNGTPATPATALASRVLPVPGGPT